MPLDDTTWTPIEIEARSQQLGWLDPIGRALTRARDLEMKFWGRGSLRTGTGICALHAIQRSTGSPHPYGLPNADLIWRWNDRQKENREILAAFDAAIADPCRRRWRFTREGIADECAIALATQIVEADRRAHKKSAGRDDPTGA